MVRASAGERELLQLRFSELCAIDSSSGDERACAERVTAELRSLGLEVEDDGAGPEVGSNCGNLLCRVPGADGTVKSVLLCAHLDTVPAVVPIEPVLVDGRWRNARQGILGADNKAAVAMLLVLARRHRERASAVELELLFTVGEERALAGARAFDVSRLHSTFGYVFDHASPIGEVVVASPAHVRLEARFKGRAAHAGIRPETGRSAIVAAALAVGAMRLGRLDEETTANVGVLEGGTAMNVVPEHARLVAEARGIEAQRLEQVIAEMVDHLQDAANTPGCECDLDIRVERLFDGYRTPPAAPALRFAELALERCGHRPRHISSGGASDANAFNALGLQCVNLANGTERNHEPDESVSASALEEMLDVALALVEEIACSAS